MSKPKDKSKTKYTYKLEIYFDSSTDNVEFIEESLTKDEDVLFYLRARGIPKKEAKALLTYGFANNILESVNIPELKFRIKKIIAKKLGVSLGFDL